MYGSELSIGQITPFFFDTQRALGVNNNHILELNKFYMFL